MKAGTIAMLAQPVSTPLESKLPDYKPWFDVEGKEETLDGTPVQYGQAVGTVRNQQTDWFIAEDQDGEKSLQKDEGDAPEHHATEWIADVTDTGLLAASSTADVGNIEAFPFDLIRIQTGVPVETVWIDVAELHSSWRSQNVILEQWNVGQKDRDDNVEIHYHEPANEFSGDANIGLGFSRSWDNMPVRGIVYASGYIALFSVHSASGFVRFVDECILPYAETSGSSQVPLSDIAEGEA